LGRLTQIALARELERLRADLDRFWKEEFARNGRPLYHSPGRLVECREQGCYYAAPGSRYPEGAILYNTEELLTSVKRYGRVSLVFTESHEFGHNAQENSAIPYSDPQSELLADRLAGAYVAHLHSQRIVLSDQPFYGAGKIEPGRSPCPEDDLRAFRQYVESSGDPDLSKAFRSLPFHGLGAPIFHGTGEERWRAFYEGYKNGIPPDLFRFGSNVR